MTRYVVGTCLMIVAVPALACAQYRGDRGSVASVPSIAATPAEGQVLSVLNRMATNRELYLAVDADNGRMLRLLAESIGAKNAVEIGTSTGYSGLWTLLGLRGTGGRLTTFEIDPRRAEQARKHFQEAGVDAQVTVVVGDAHENVKQLKGPIDLLFLDADKEGYASYLQTLLPLVRPGGLIAADNIASAPDYVKAVTTDPRLDTVFFGRFAVTMKKR
jgi:caffeoyl-CoA O-methyltransferase